MYDVRTTDFVFQHIFHGKVKNIAIASDPHSPFHYHQGSYYINPCYHSWHAFFFSLTIFSPMICDWGIFFYSRDPSFMSLIDSLLFVKFSKMANFNFRESWFGFFLFSEIRDENPPPSMETVGKQTHDLTVIASDSKTTQSGGNNCKKFPLGAALQVPQNFSFASL